MTFAHLQPLTNVPTKYQLPTPHGVGKTKIDGLLMLIDFEKVFDSISWSFMLNVLEKLGFGQEFIEWIKILNKHITDSFI